MTPLFWILLYFWSFIFLVVYEMDLQRSPFYKKGTKIYGEDIETYVLMSNRNCFNRKNFPVRNSGTFWAGL